MLALLPVFVNERYRLAAAPGLLLLSAYFAVELWRLIVSGQWLRVAGAAALAVLSTWFVTLSPGDRALWSLDDYHTARRHIIAGEHEHGAMRMGHALEAMLGRQHLAPAIANGFAEVAREQLENGDRAGAISTIDAAIAINPADERLRQLRERVAPL